MDTSSQASKVSDSTQALLYKKLLGNTQKNQGGIINVKAISKPSGSNKPSNEIIALKDIASKMAKTGEAKEALKTAQSIHDPKETAKGIEMLRQLWLKPLQMIYPLPIIQGDGK
jgi:hypothetical protein